MTIEQKALELVNAVRWERDLPAHDTHYIQRANAPDDEALCRALEAHEADKARHAAELREQAERFSEAAKEVIKAVKPDPEDDENTARYVEWRLSPFILASDPLVEALTDLGLEKADEWAPDIRKAMAARGLAIVKKEAVNG